jgi:4-hydroxy-tetrahydrodipicolinate reductase
MTTATLGIVGATGRMGRAVERLAAAHYRDALSVGARIGSGDAFDALAGCDVVVDFSLPAGTEALADWLETEGTAVATLVSGTTGLPEALLDRLEALSTRRRVMHASNFSAGVAAVRHILASASPMLASLGYTPVMTETHHRHKQDAPSGTALTLNAAMTPWDAEGIQTHSIRAGEVIGRHDVSFYSDHDRIVIGHDAGDRDLFARGAIDAALWLSGREPGWYTMASYFEARFGS